ncbi:MAG: hypothetical protein PVG53_00025 [Holophagae bacterium]|jgi:hypothetical protein
MANPRILVLLVVAALLVTGGAAAQWSTDPAAPLVIADRSGPQVQSKIAACADGGFYVSWYDSSTGGYDVYLQRLDAAGNELWDHNGVLVADRSFSSTQDYGLSTDTSGNALLAFRDDRGATTEITVAKISPLGAPLWGASGVQVSTGGLFVAAPKVAGTTDGFVVVAWTSEADVKVQKLDDFGTPEWGSGITFSPPAGSFGVADLHASDAGAAIVSFTHLTGSFPSPVHLWAQKLASADGSSLWGAGHVQVYDQAGGSLQFGNFPAFVPDGSGGAVFAWYTNSPTLQVRAQRVLANGTEVFAHNGVEVSTDATRLRVDGVAAFHPATSETFVAWTEENSNQSLWGLYAQKLDAAGLRQWTDTGRELIALGTEQISTINVMTLDDGALISWIRSPTFGNEPISATRVDGNGVFVWMPSTVEICSLATESSRLVGAMGSGGFAAYAWSDGGSSTGDILAAALNPDGTLGGLGLIFSDGFESGDTGAWTGTSP